MEVSHQLHALATWLPTEWDSTYWVECDYAYKLLWSRP